MLYEQTIDSSNKLDDAEKQQYLATYQQVREGKKDLDPAMGAALDLFIYTSSNLPANAQVVYKEAREESLAGDENLANNILLAVDRSHDLQQGMRQASQDASALVPSTTKLLSAAALEAGTGVSIGSLTAAPPPESLAGLIADKIEQSQYQQVEVFIAPQLPLNLLANAHKSWFKPSENERMNMIKTSLVISSNS